MIVTTGRRVASPGDLKYPGDYSGPFPELEGPDLTPSGAVAVWLLAPDGSGLVRFASPPWTFTECPDGALEITEAALAVIPNASRR